VLDLFSRYVHANATERTGGRRSCDGERTGVRNVPDLTAGAAAVASAAATPWAEVTGAPRHDVALVMGSGWVPAADALGPA
jgi:hypothetical protein